MLVDFPQDCKYCYDGFALESPWSLQHSPSACVGPELIAGRGLC